MSSFKRAVKAPTSSVDSLSTNEPLSDASSDLLNIVTTGVKPWVSTGLGIVSSGNKQLDELIGGGSALGTLTLIETDSFSSYGETLALYGLAESISHKHSVLLVSEDSTESERVMAALPYNQTISSAVVGSENTVRVGETAGANKLTIAWQYDKYIKKEEAPVRRSSSGDAPVASYCCSYDLSRRLQVGILENATVEMCDVSDLSSRTATTTNSSTTAANLAEVALSKIAQAVKEFVLKHNKNSKSVSRIVISSLDQVLSAVGDNTHHALSSHAVAKFVLQLKHIIRSSRVSLSIFANPGTLNSEIAAKVRHVADTVLSVESFAGRTHSVPHEFKDFQGFLVVHKLQQYGTMAPFRPPGTRFGLKRDRRKLHIEPLHLPPEESRAFSTTGGAEKPAANAGGVSSGVGAAEGVQIHSHSGATTSVDLAHGHSHAQSVLATSTTPSSSTSGSASGRAETSAAAAPLPAPVKLTPLQASLAALKAARLNAAAPVTVSAAGSSTNSSSTTTPPVALVSIQRPVPAANIVNKQAPAAQPPLQPGQACGAQSRSGTADSVYDF